VKSDGRIRLVAWLVLKNKANQQFTSDQATFLAQPAEDVWDDFVN